ncbi:START domain-containing protein 10-like isoform X2 [Sitophilus oryzae]|nr:START domain-containing protein 10-like isoform X2 [Sitophilus oryzae]XP_030755428.1 START domain-containing protein 10-like isoform X2 [Sitophilus oryzae]XP_030755429.1 START domain-containing protein 10-like isoform X2 [Sitophilus oryzae]
MEIGVVKIAEDSDFAMLKRLVDNHDSWRLEYENKPDQIKVWSKTTSTSSFRMVKIHSVFNKISAETMFDVLHDPDYRKEWDEHMMASIDIGYLNPNNDVGYYALSCPSPLKNRDFVLQRSWLDMNDEKLILNHSVNHKDYGPRREFIRAVSYLTGFVVRRRNEGCFLGYISQTDPRGKLPSWLVNKVTQKLAPNVVKQLKLAAEGYEMWKIRQKNPLLKPWINPEQILGPKISIADVSYSTAKVDQHLPHTDLGLTKND